MERSLCRGDSTEHTHRPALKTLIEQLGAGLTATNEPKQCDAGAPDFIVMRGEVPIGYVEAKDVGKSLDVTEKSEQLERYREGLSNLILTDYLEFRWYRDGELAMEPARIARADSKGNLTLDIEGVKHAESLFESFFIAKAVTVSSPRELAERMARIARLLQDAIGKAMKTESKETGPLHSQLEGFHRVLLHDLTEAQFADMYAQTVCYGLFAARTNHTGQERFTRQHAPYELPNTNPFLKKLFSQIAGPDMAESIAWAVDNLTELLNAADIGAILRDFGRRTLRQDPVVHFYETFLAAYDPRMRELRGVYYTPEPVVSYIVRSIDHILKSDFGLEQGLADHSRVEVDTGSGKKTVHKVQILDPSTGTGTFLHGVVDHIHETFKGAKGMWSGYVATELLPRLYGFELLMAPYAVAHMKLGIQLAETGYDFKSGERLNVYLTNTLEEAVVLQNPGAFDRFLNEERDAANRVKKDAPVMVVLGNPPYSGHSANIGQWMTNLLRGVDSTAKVSKTHSYFHVDGKELGERNPKWLNDDYVKFIRFAQWRIEQTGYGVLGFITNHGYLDNPTFRGMRQSLMDTFDDIYILDLHGNAKKKETAPDGGEDKNVFDIQQGVSIGIFVKRKGKKTTPATVRHADLWGAREKKDSAGRIISGKYAWLAEKDVSSTRWKKLKPHTPHYLFIPQDERLRKEYEAGWSIKEIMPVNSVGITTARDDLTIAFDEEEIWKRVKDFARLPVEEARSKYDLGNDAQDWKVSLAQEDLRKSGLKKELLKPVLYRPFDTRNTYYTGASRGFHCRTREDVMRHMLAGRNLGLCTTRSIEIGRGWEHSFCTKNLIQHHTVSIKEVNYLFPLYLYPNKKTNGDIFTNGLAKHVNLAPEFIAEFEQKLSIKFIPDGKGTLRKTFGPEDVFHYIYAIFHSPTYRDRYAPFLKGDFPRVPLTANVELFKKLARLGERLTALHLMEASGSALPLFPVMGDGVVEKPRYTQPGDGADEGRVFINKTQYFAPVPPEVWNFHVGGYQVAEKWLKDRKGRQLSFVELEHYRKTIAALAETIALMGEIDTAVEEHAGWPIG
ncbi:MAG: N-6 DNA methylase [Nitrospinae bacterium]|nr:N-6 DNA methylase [Nitrospinota bacterium]MBF0634089.1 N-6 DNA methylase [Nitrospinota bacterium]